MTKHEVIVLTADECTELTGADLVLHIPVPYLHGPTDEDSDESDDETLGKTNHLGKVMLNTLSDVVPHYRDQAAEMDKALPSTSGLSPAATTKKKRKKVKVSQEILWKKKFLFLTKIIRSSLLK